MYNFMVLRKENLYHELSTLVSSVSEYQGEELKLTKISRNEMGVYLCIASNSVPPAVSKRIFINVHFSPVIHVPNQLVGAPLGTDVGLECFVEASPKSINYWVKDNGRQDWVLREVNINRIRIHVTLGFRFELILLYLSEDLGIYDNVLAGEGVISIVLVLVYYICILVLVYGCRGQLVTGTLDATVILKGLQGKGGDAFRPEPVSGLIEGFLTEDLRESPPPPSSRNPSIGEDKNDAAIILLRRGSWEWLSRSDS
ncbi:Lachesin [Eufriesea mexicana]|uniref:Lachesin n=1 Tax=Eufriesea mexicana TaxID=516756 RepID=A0A310SXP3_9HYME|nr:Lachesin [Eufriesea mexicana]